MSRRLLLDPDAERDLDAIFDYIGERNPDAAARYIRALRDQCGLYAESPFTLGQAEPDIARRLGLPRECVRSFLYRNHRCYYVVTDDEMRVFGFIDVRRDIDAVLEERLGS
ncbi:MAG TPA: type II toxin-antitoxin system RelE/ParE family toxin [Candidatus Tectomicrobia bacterium]|jgi:plasmid stabilization system protein ParE